MGQSKHLNFSSLNRKFYDTKGATLAGDLPLVVLINKGSASASEILSGAILDHKRGILIGTTTFGKGSVQSILPLDNEYAMRYTTAYYYTPNGIKIHKIGIKPDIEVEVPALTKSEIDDIRKIKDEKLVAEFIKKNKKPEDKKVEKFINELRGKKFILSDRLIKRLINQEEHKNKRMPLYDLDFDVQLKMSLQILKSEISVILNRSKNNK